MILCANCGHDQAAHRWGESWCTSTYVLRDGGGPCDCGEFIDPDDVIVVGEGQGDLFADEEGA